jgi:hypothetical protein
MSAEEKNTRCGFLSQTLDSRLNTAAIDIAATSRPMLEDCKTV